MHVWKNTAVKCKYIFSEMYTYNLDVVFQQISTLLEDSMAIVYGPPLINSFYYNLLIKSPKAHKQQPQNLLEMLQICQKTTSSIHKYMGRITSKGLFKL